MSAVAAKRMTLPIAAQRLGVSYERAKRMLLNGTLSGVQIAGRCWLVDADSVGRALAANSPDRSNNTNEPLPKP